MLSIGLPSCQSPSCELLRRFAVCQPDTTDCIGGTRLVLHVPGSSWNANLLLSSLCVTWHCRCKTLDASADGYVRAEAVGCAILVPASAVPEGMLPGLVLLSGSAVNQDGRSSSLTAPNGPSQQGVIRQALQGSPLEPHQIQALQLHGTGTHQNNATLCASFL